MIGRIIPYICIAALPVVSTTGIAAPAVYTIDGTGTGALGGTSFRNADFVITLTGDTSVIQSTLFGQILDPLASASIYIAGLGSSAFSMSTRIGVNTFGTAFFSRSSSIGGFDLLDFQLASPVNLSSTFLPIAGDDVSALDQFQDVSTSQGGLSFTSASNIQFGGQVGVIGSAVPEPCSWAMFIGGFGMIGGAMRSRRKIAVTFSRQTT